MTDAMNGTNATDVPTRANEIRERGKKEESHAIPRRVNATNPFQNALLEVDGMNHSSDHSNKNAAAEATRRSNRKLHRSS
jgi:hypothetical protein